MDSTMQWKELTEISGRLEADMLAAFLQAEGVPVELFQESVGQHVYPTIVGSFGRVRLFVHQDTFAQALSLLEEYQKGNVEMEIDPQETKTEDNE